jgi:hypothetical protein
MASYSSSDTFQQQNSTLSNGYNLFPGTYMSTKVGGEKRSKKPATKKVMKKVKGGCGCGAKTGNTVAVYGGKGSKSRKARKTMRAKSCGKM